MGAAKCLAVVEGRNEIKQGRYVSGVLLIATATLHLGLFSFHFHLIKYITHYCVT